VATPFRVLAIDGGGIRGVIPATVLVDLERRLVPRPLATVFDLIVGTSTGGIIALGLTVPDGERPRHSAERLLELYLNDGEAIFPGGGRVAHPRAGWLREGTRYLASELEEVLARYFGGTPLTAALTAVVVTSYDLGRGEPVTLSSRAELGDVSDVTMVVAARATSAAPMFFAPEIVLYQAGADPYVEDQLGGLALTLAGLEARDRMVLSGCARRGIPAVVTLGGGYARRVEDTVAIHATTCRVALAAAPVRANRPA